MNYTVIHHSADYDGIFCREIARKFLPDAELIGWDFADEPLEVPEAGMVYIIDLPVDRVFGWTMPKGWGHFIKYDGFKKRLIWIDHHKSSIESHPTDIPGYRIDGVAACRLAWQHFCVGPDLSKPDWKGYPTKQDYIDRKVSEPLSVRLAGEYDVWDHRGDGDVEFQFGMDACALTPKGWDVLLSVSAVGDEQTRRIVEGGAFAMRCYAKRDADVMRSRGFLVVFEGLKFLALNTARCNSNTFASRDIPETGHDALMGFNFNGKLWTVSLYHAKHRTDLDLSKIAVKHGGGGHKGACGFTSATFPL